MLCFSKDIKTNKNYYLTGLKYQNIKEKNRERSETDLLKFRQYLICISVYVDNPVLYAMHNLCLLWTLYENSHGDLYRQKTSSEVLTP